MLIAVGSALIPDPLSMGYSKAGTFNQKSGIFSTATNENKDSFAASAKYGDNMVSMSYGTQGRSLVNSQGTAASAGRGNVGAASTKMITNSARPLLLGSGSAGSSNALIGPGFATMDLRGMTLAEGVRMAGVRNGTEAFAVIGSSRVYKNGDDVVAQSSGTGCAGVTGNKVWVHDSEYGSAEAQLCDCTIKRRGTWCYCACHCGTARKH
jgi:hypothetical protein